MEQDFETIERLNDSELTEPTSLELNDSELTEPTSLKLNKIISLVETKCAM